MGRMSQSVRLLLRDREFKADFIERVRVEVERGKIGVPVEIQGSGQGTSVEYWLSPLGNY
jgi:hypothetical protein